MNILVPIQTLADMEPLAKAGALEMYCGYLPDLWITLFNNENIVDELQSVPCCLNNRNALKSNLRSFKELKDCVAIAKRIGVRLYVTLNSKYYPEEAYAPLRSYLIELRSAGVERLIVSDLGMVSYLSETFPEFMICISCLEQVTNQMSIAFFSSFPNVERIVFPRHVTVEEVIKMVKAFPDVEFEYFGLSNKCLYDDGYCRGIHDLFPICKDIWGNEFFSVQGEIPSGQLDILAKETETFSRWSREYSRSVERAYRWKGVACSLCSLYNLYSYHNIAAIKLAGRGYELEERITQVQMTSKIIKMIDQGADIAEIRQKVKDWFGYMDYCNGQNCIMRGRKWK